MTEILTESFCERCGTRYTFEPVADRRKPLKAIGTLGRGIRHFVSDPGSTAQVGSYLSFRAWGRTTGSRGEWVDASIVGGLEPFSAIADRIGVKGLGR